MRKTIGKTIFFGSGAEGKENRSSERQGKLDLSIKTDIQVEMPSRQLSIIAWRVTQRSMTQIYIVDFSEY